MSTMSNTASEICLASLLNDARIIDLEQPRFEGQPGLKQHGVGMQFTLHRRHEPGLARRTSASGIYSASDHAGTHIDAYCHQAVDCVMYEQTEVTALNQTATGFTMYDAEKIPPIICPGVLLDLTVDAPYEPCQTITVADLKKAAEGLTIPVGAAILVRSGWDDHWEDPALFLQSPGFNLEASTWLADKQPLAVGIDNAYWDEIGVFYPELGYRSPGHAVFLQERGIYMIENLALQELAQSGHKTFTFICLPIKLRGATAAPVRPIALV